MGLKEKEAVKFSPPPPYKKKPTGSSFLFPDPVDETINNNNNNNNSNPEPENTPLAADTLEEFFENLRLQQQQALSSFALSKRSILEDLNNSLSSRTLKKKKEKRMMQFPLDVELQQLENPPDELQFGKFAIGAQFDSPNIAFDNCQFLDNYLTDYSQIFTAQKKSASTTNLPKFDIPPTQLGGSQNLGRKSVFPTSFVEEEKKRSHIIQEILSSEDTYVKSLETCYDCFYLPLKDMIGTKDQILKQNQLDTIFCNLPKILKTNQKFFSFLEQRITSRNWDPDYSTIGDIFLNFVSSFEDYKIYVKKQEDSLSLLKNLEKNNQWTTFLGKVKKLNQTGRLDIDGFLIMPVQRIPRYELLLKDLIQKTPQNHPDYELMKKSEVAISEIANAVNQDLRQQANFNELLRIEQTWKDLSFPLVTHGRRFIKEGDLLKSYSKENKKRHFVLFSDILIYGKAIGDKKYQLSKTCALDSRFKLIEVQKEVSSPHASKHSSVSPKDNASHAIQIISATHSFTVFAESAIEKQAWIRAFAPLLNPWQIQNSSADQPKIIQVDISSNVAPVWIPDSAAKWCMVCAKKFTVVRRRHHCRNCGKVVCGDCSKDKQKLAHGTEKEQRVCSFCFKFLVMEK